MKKFLKIIVLFLMFSEKASANDLPSQDTTINNGSPKVPYTVLPVPKRYMFNTSGKDPAIITKTAAGYEITGSGFASPFAPMTPEADRAVRSKARRDNPIADHLKLLSAADEIEIAYSALKTGEMKVTIYDISGRNVHSERTFAEIGLNWKKVPISFLKAGIYIIVLEKHGEKKYSKFIKGG